MRVGIDARELCGRATGVGRVLSGLLSEWATGGWANAHELVLYAPEPPASAPAGDRFTLRVVPGAGGTWWEQVTLMGAARRDDLDVWYSPAYTAPLRMRVPTVVLVHDVSFVAHPEWFRTREGASRRFFCRHAAHRARAVITISEFSRREIVKWLGIPEERIHVILPGVQARSSRRPPASGPCRVLFVGSIFNRRHVPDLVRAFAPIARARPDVSLDIVGDDRSFPPEDLPAAIAAEGLGAQIRWHHYVTDDELGALYAGARAFAFLSEYEGLGLTPLEALAGGIPPVLLDTPVARESCGDAALYVAPGDLASATAALERALFSEDTRSRLLGAAPAALAKFQWARAADDLAALLEGCARR
jgi:glycosyltransferase involved in cell wall biosynthesis